jgi:hypothetical protein
VLIWDGFLALVSLRGNFTTTMDRLYMRLSPYFEPDNRVMQLEEFCASRRPYQRTFAHGHGGYAARSGY